MKTTKPTCDTGVVIILIMITTPILCQGQLPAPTLVSPADGYQVSLSTVMNAQFVLDWTDVQGATKYHVDIQGPPGFTNFHQDPVISQLTFSITSIKGQYFWKAQAFDAQNLPGEYSEKRGFYVYSGSPPTPTPTSVPPTLPPTATPAAPPTSIPTFALIPGDVNLDGLVNQKDLYLISLSWLTEAQQSGYVAIRDINHDGNCNWEDLFIFLRHWKK